MPPESEFRPESGAWDWPLAHPPSASRSPTPWLFATYTQRELMYTEHKPQGRLWKMCDPFFHEFRVILSANGFLLVCYTVNLFTSSADEI
jgi:hypothetical protein